MKFIFADSMDHVDPRFNFLTDQYGANREAYWDDVFPHELLTKAPYDGVLLSRAMIGEPNFPGKMNESLSMRFRRVGARAHLRLTAKEQLEMPIFGDNGAFSYCDMPEPPYTAADTVEFYGQGQFTHGCAVDHIIFEFDKSVSGLNGGNAVSKKRFEITLNLASEFFEESKKLDNTFTPIGVIQGWSPDSLAHAARELVKIGYRYLAIGGMVPLTATDTHIAVTAVTDAIKQWPGIKVHLLGFAKADNLHEFVKYKQVASFDTTSPLLKAFKDSVKNYYLPNDDGSIDYYTAIRIPQAISNNKLKTHAKTGLYKQEHLLEMESAALSSLRMYAAGQETLENTLNAVMEYTKPLHNTPTADETQLLKHLSKLEEKYIKTLKRRPWEDCNCDVCNAIGVEGIIFRGSNRNKRRGIHNLNVYHNHLNRILIK